MAKEVQVTNTLYECDICGKMSYSKDFAENCCKPRLCNKCGCEIPSKSCFLTCDDCREKEWFEKATKILPQDYKEDMVYFKDNYHYSIEDCLDGISEEELKNVTYVQGCERNRHELNYDNIITDFENDADIEDFQIGKQGVTELKEFLEKWNKKYGIDIYYPNNVAILINDEFKKEV